MRNPAYSGPAAHLAEVDFTFVPVADVIPAQYRAFQAGQVDYAIVPYTLAEAAKATYGPKKEFSGTVFPGTSFLVPNTKNPPFNNAEARQAVSYAIDRDALIAGIFKSFNVKATSFVPPALASYYQPDVCQSCVRQDVAKAKQLAIEGGMPPGTRVNFVYHTGVNDEPWVQAVAQQLKDVLGLDVNLQSFTFPQQTSAENDPAASGLFRLAWEADYPSGDDFLRPTLSTAAEPPGDNHGRYENPRFDALLDRAVATPDESQRADLIKAAERIAIGDDQAVIPLWHRIQYNLFSEKFKNVGLDWFEGPDLRAISIAT